MSTAFRNFIITFALAAALFAVIGYMVVSGVLDGLFKSGENASGDETEYSYENAESYYKGEYDASEEEIPSSEAIGESYIVFYEDHLGELNGAKFICVNEKNGKLVQETLPITSTIVVNGYNRTIKEIYESNGEEFLCGKLQYIFGVSVNSYVVFTPESMIELFSKTDIFEKLEIEISCNLPYQVKYEDPEMKDYNDQNPDDIQYITLAGEAVITAENAQYIFDNVPEDSYDSKAASTMFSQIYDSVFTSAFSNEKLKNTSSSVERFFGCFERCSIKSEKYSVLFGIYDGSYEKVNFSDLSAMSGKELNWSVLPSSLEAALK